MKGIEPQNDLVPSPPNRSLNSVFCDELNLFTLDPPNNRMQWTLKNIEVEKPNLYGSQPNVNRIAIGGVSRPSVLRQVKNQTSPDPRQTLGHNT